MDEDCLYLNIVTPGVDNRRRPTMVWIHGGGFLTGSGASGPYLNGAFLRDDIVLVTINYRLGPLGFLYLDEDFPGASETGNLGILDQVAALQWVRDNVAGFGGDPANITVFGESAGGTSVALLLSIPQARSTFQNVIVQSAARALTTRKEAGATSRAILDRVGVRRGDWNALRSVAPDRLLAATADVNLGAPDPILVPVMDTGLIGSFGAGVNDLRETSVIIGTTRDEWLGVWGVAPPGVLPTPDLSGPFAPELTADDVYGFYVAQGVHGDHKLYGAFDTDRLFRRYASEVADALCAGGARVWMYRLDWAPQLDHGEVGAYHALDLALVFRALDDPRSVGVMPPVTLADEMHLAWAHLAKHGDPNGTGVSEWPTYGLDVRTTLLFDIPSRLAADPDRERRELWQRAADSTT
jgi:para-nitrobenzyl esterase